MADDGKNGFTRRDLVRGTLVGAIASGVKATPPAEDLPLGPGPTPLTLKINGAVHRLSVEPRVTLVDALRERIGLTGTKVVCGRGACGACTVLVDGETACSCLLLAHDVAGREITTIEGLAAGGELTPLQEAFIEADALQCGFCTSGMVLVLPSPARAATPGPRAPRSARPSPATSAAAAPTTTSSTPSSGWPASKTAEETLVPAAGFAVASRTLSGDADALGRLARRRRHSRSHGRGGVR